MFIGVHQIGYQLGPASRIGIEGNDDDHDGASVFLDQGPRMIFASGVRSISAETASALEQ